MKTDLKGHIKCNSAWFERKRKPAAPPFVDKTSDLCFKKLLQEPFDTFIFKNI